MSARPADAAAAAADGFLEMECAQICKHGQVACGDAFGIERIDAENRALAVLSDGLGSGIKASVLSEMTADDFNKLMGEATAIQPIEG